MVRPVAKTHSNYRTTIRPEIVTILKNIEEDNLITGARYLPIICPIIQADGYTAAAPSSGCE